MICHIAAVAKNRTIGNSGELPWYLPEDLKFFKETTLNHPIIMGRKTFESIKKPLPNRVNIVITRNTEWSAEGAHVFNDVKTAVEFCDTNYSGQDIFIVGGGEIYTQTLPIADKLFITMIDQEYEGDAFYPDWSYQFEMVQKKDMQQDELKYSFCTFIRRIMN